MVIYDIQTTVDEETSHSGIKLNIQSEDVIVDEVGLVPLVELNAILDRVNSLEAGTIHNSSVINLVFPVGRIIQFGIDVDPWVLYENTEWTKIEECFLFASSINYPTGSTGGSNSVVLTQNNLPAHNHNVSVAGSGTLTTGNNTHNHSSFAKIRGLGSGSFDIRENASSPGDESKTTSSDTHSHNISSHGHTVSQTTIGQGQAFNNMPFYKAVSTWQRTA